MTIVTFVTTLKKKHVFQLLSLYIFNKYLRLPFTRQVWFFLGIYGPARYSPEMYHLDSGPDRTQPSQLIPFLSILFILRWGMQLWPAVKYIARTAILLSINQSKSLGSLFEIRYVRSSFSQT